MTYVLFMAMMRYNSAAFVSQEFTSYERCMQAGAAMVQDIAKAESGQAVRWGCFQK